MYASKHTHTRKGSVCMTLVHPVHRLFSQLCYQNICVPFCVWCSSTRYAWSARIKECSSVFKGKRSVFCVQNLREWPPERAKKRESEKRDFPNVFPHSGIEYHSSHSKTQHVTRYCYGNALSWTEISLIFLEMLFLLLYCCTASEKFLHA